MDDGIEPVLPQRATHAETLIESVDWLFEPYWPGDRLLARLADGRISLTDARGEQVDEAFAEAAWLLDGAIDAETALIDGIWTAQQDVGNGGVVRRRAAMIEAGRGDEAPDPIPMEARSAFVAIDLLELDGVSLLEIPYQERRRLMESVVRARGRVRISPAVRLPARPWVDAWRSDGFAFYVAKEINSRYRPGETVDDWLVLSAPPAEAPSMVSWIFGGRSKRLPRVKE
jgi:bifunctional non-homologous end joining protein LigD